MHLRMNAGLRSGDKVLETKNLTVGYPDGEPLFTAPDMVLRRGEIAALIGPNGAGKTTFVKTVIGQLAPLSGEVKLGAAVKLGYFAQAHELLNEDNSILDEILSVKEMGLGQTRNYLGQFLFQGDDVFRPIRTLSGGERGRVALAKLALAGANFLLLDEPTNHLDIDSQEILQTVLAGFGGTILLVSHDRYLISALATQIWTVSPGKLDVFNGTYSEYVAARQKAAASAADEGSRTKTGGDPPNVAEKKQGLNPHQVQKRVAELEARIPQLETQLEEISDAIGVASARADTERVRSLGEDYTRTEAELHATMQEWERLLDEI
jgi:ATP-binding cassette subfamily F protein 3